MNKKLFSLSLLIVNTQFNTYAARDYLQALKAKQAAQGEQQPEASSSQHPSGFFGFDAHTVVPSSFEPIIGTAGSHGIGTEIKIQEHATIEGQLTSLATKDNVDTDEFHCIFKTQVEHNKYFDFDPHAIIEPTIGTMGRNMIKSKDESTAQNQDSKQEEASSSNPKPNSDACDDYIAENFDKLMANTQVKEGDCEATIQERRKLKEYLAILRTKTVLALSIEMQKKQKAEQSAKTTQNQDSKQPEASSSHDCHFN